MNIIQKNKFHTRNIVRDKLGKYSISKRRHALSFYIRFARVNSQLFR